ncbi:MAG: hypothetical protein RLY66_198 [Candidatus Parcubacteria bacterium]|jgi:hypothetical protein
MQPKTKLVPLIGFTLPPPGPALNRVNLMVFEGELVRHPGGTFSCRIPVDSPEEEIVATTVLIGPKVMNPGPARSLPLRLALHKRHDGSDTDLRRYIRR